MGISINKAETLNSVMIEVKGGGGLLATMLDRDGQLPDRGMLVWSGQRESSDGALRLTGSADGGARLVADLQRVGGAVVEIALCLAGDPSRHEDGGGAVRVVDQASGRTLAHIAVTPSASGLTREIGRLARAGAGWRFVETGRDYADGLDAMLRRYGIGAATTTTARGTESPEARFVALIAESHPARYCDAAERTGLLGQGARLGLDGDTAETVLDLELERRGVANEAALLARLDAVLRRFTDKDRKLDDKERRDALQLVCKAGPGFAQGLRHDVADQYVTRFCRERGVKVRVGLLRWAVP